MAAQSIWRHYAGEPKRHVLVVDVVDGPLCTVAHSRRSTINLYLAQNHVTLVVVVDHDISPPSSSVARSFLVHFLIVILTL